ncbi:hypothetical protein ACIRPK_35305 [Kitasatospora sp. NPDC101801]|uniref:hypothetical protein n=1 Tax=Kitasatospora sp. NPDC101801 TaxID=3364103 RepID=UPI00380A2C3F
MVASGPSPPFDILKPDTEDFGEYVPSVFAASVASSVVQPVSRRMRCWSGCEVTARCPPGVAAVSVNSLVIESITTFLPVLFAFANARSASVSGRCLARSESNAAISLDDGMGVGSAANATGLVRLRAVAKAPPTAHRR